MRLVGVNATVLLVLCASISLSVSGQARQAALEVTEVFVQSLNEHQQGWWRDNQEKLFNSLVSAVMDSGNASHEVGEGIAGMSEFVKSLDTEQQKMWAIIKEKASKAVTEFLVSPATNTLGQRSRRSVCGGGCITSDQCVKWSGKCNCRCTWFTCRLY